VGNDDRISFAASLSTEFSGTSVNAMVASLREDSEVDGKAQETIGASFGVSMANGLGISGAWARGDNHGSKAGSAAVPAEMGFACRADEGKMDDGSGTTSGSELHAKGGDVVTPGPDPDDPSARLTCGDSTFVDGVGVASTYEYGETMAAVPAKHAMAGPDPSYFQAGIAYSFGDTTVSASWYNSEDFVEKGSEGTAIGIGVNHNMPKVGAQVYAAVQSYSVEEMEGAESKDATVAVVGTRVRF